MLYAKDTSWDCEGAHVAWMFVCNDIKVVDLDTNKDLSDGCFLESSQGMQGVQLVQQRLQIMLCSRVMAPDVYGSWCDLVRWDKSRYYLQDTDCPQDFPCTASRPADGSA